MNEDRFERDEAWKSRVADAEEAREKKIYLVGRLMGVKQWEVGGIFTNEEVAVEVCKTAEDFVWPCVLDEEAPDQTEEMPGAYFPLKG